MSTYTAQRTIENSDTGEHTDKYVFDDGRVLIAEKRKIATGYRTTYKLDDSRILKATAEGLLEESVLVFEIPDNLPEVEADTSAAETESSPEPNELTWLEAVADQAREGGWTVDDSTGGVVLGKIDWAGGHFEFACKVNDLIGQSAVVKYIDAAGNSKFLPVSPWQMTRPRCSEPVLASPYFYV